MEEVEAEGREGSEYQGECLIPNTSYKQWDYISAKSSIERSGADQVTEISGMGRIFFHLQHAQFCNTADTGRVRSSM